MDRGERKKNVQAWSGFILIIIVGMLIGIYCLRVSYGADLVDTNMEMNLLRPRGQTATEAKPLQLFVDTDRTFTFGYPGGCTATASTSGTAETAIYSVKLEGEGVDAALSVSNVSMEGLIRNSLSVERESEVTISGQPALKIEGSSLKDGSLQTLIILKSGETLYSWRGYGRLFENIVESFEIL